jgi:membrane protease subunit HflK
MSDDHDHDHSKPGHEHPHGSPEPSAPVDPVMEEDAGSRALSEALKSSFFIVKVVMGVLVGVFLGSGFFIVSPQQRAIILRLGAPHLSGTNVLLEPGLHWAFPAPIDEVRKIPFSAIQTVKSTVGWYYTTPELEASGQEPMAGSSLNPATDGYVITADGNIVHTRASLSYRVADPVKYEFDFTSSSNAVQNALDNALIFAASRFTVDDILTRQVTKFRETVQARVVELTSKQDLGIEVEQCEVKSIPPRTLKPAFDAVAAALSMAESARNSAQSEASQILGRATVSASSITNAAETERLRLVESVNVEAKSFAELLPRYQANSNFVVNILLSQKIAQVLSNVQDTIFLPERADGQKRELRLMLSREPKGSKPAAPPSNQ